MTSADLHPVHQQPITFAGGAVVQALPGADPGEPAAVSTVRSATIIVTDQRVVASDGGFEWSWLVADLRGVHHGDGAWTLLETDGLHGFGVSVPAADVDAFRAVVDALPGVAALPPGSGDASSASQLDTLSARLHAPLGAPPEPTLAINLIAGTPTQEIEVTPRSRRRFGRWRAAEVVEVVEVGEIGEVGEPAPFEPAARPLVGIDAREICAWFGSHQVLDRVSLDMPAGEVTALIGPSGCGKSTFLRILNRMHELIPSAALAGEVLLDGQDIYDASRKLTDARREIGMVFQKPNPFPAMSIYDNVVASLRLTGTKASTEQKDEIVESCLTKAGLWTEVRDRLRQPGGGLSGGQQQRLCIARALAIRPRVLLMDEPCSALDPTSTRRIEETIRELVTEVTIVIVTHNMQQAARVSDRCAFFLAEQGTPGVIVEYGPTEAMFGWPQDQRTSDYVNGRFG